jgi:hypothetical protein
VSLCLRLKLWKQRRKKKKNQEKSQPLLLCLFTRGSPSFLLDPTTRTAHAGGMSAQPPPPPPPPGAGAGAGAGGAGPSTSAGANAASGAAANGNKVDAVRAQVDAVRAVMAQNVEQVLERGERLDVLEDKADDLSGQAAAFQRQGAALRRKMWWQEKKTKLFGALAIVLVLLVLFALACYMGGRNCLSGESSGGGEAVDGPGPLLGSGSGSGGGSSSGVTVLPDGTAVVSTPLPFVAPPAPPAPPGSVDAPGVLTPEEAALAMAVGKRRRRV